MGHESRSATILGVTLGLGLALAGWFVARGLYAARATERYVTVNGFAERELPADLAIWPVVFNASSNDLIDLQNRLDASAAKVYEFLGRQGFSSADWSLSSPRVTDFSAQGYRADGPSTRYAGEATVTLRTGKVEAVKAAIQKSGELVASGVALLRSYEYDTTYLFTGLDSIKPQMIAEATRDARNAAEQFAQDSGSKVGAIRNARQGYFSIEPRDPFSPEHKKVRVVTTVQYFLED